MINFTTVVKGRQYDRTGVMYLGDTEVWRTSTAEPTASGIRWVWLQDMTPFLSLWKKPQTLIFDLGNLVNENYTGILNTTLEATFFKSDLASPPPADLVIPITRRLGSTGKPSQFLVPEQNATNTVGFPRNANRAVFSVDVKAEGAEEFWWANVPHSDRLTFADTTGALPGYSPWREVRVLLDGRLVGVVWPFPVVYTGGVVPQLHRPIVGIDAFDIREHEIDITPWLPLLCDGKKHTFTINVVGFDNTATSSYETPFSTIESSWYVTGKIFVWLDDEGSVTTGTINSVSQSPVVFDLSSGHTTDAAGKNNTLQYQMTMSRGLLISSHVKSQKREGTVTWKQILNYTNKGYVYDYGNASSNDFSIVGTDEGDSFSTRYGYPLYCNQSMNMTGDGLTLFGLLDQGLKYVTTGSPVFPTGLEAFSNKYNGASLMTWRNGSADYNRPSGSNRSSGTGRTEQTFLFGGHSPSSADNTVTPLYYRRVSAFNDSVTMDREELLGKVIDHPGPVPHLPSLSA